MEPSQKPLFQQSDSDEEKKSNKPKSTRDSEGKLYMCGFCSKSYKFKSTLKVHKKKNHSTVNSHVRCRGRPKNKGKEEITNEINPRDIAYSQSEQKKGALTNEMGPSSHNQSKNKGDIFKPTTIRGEKKHRTFKTIKGLSYRCEFCSKKFSSFNDLSPHLKEKHDIFKTCERDGDNVFYPFNRTYFNSQQRRGTVTEFKEPIIKAFEELSAKHGELGKETLKQIQDHRFLNLYLSDPHDLTKKVKDKSENMEGTCDVAFMEYLNRMSVHVNPTYFSRLIIFVTLFCDYINDDYRNKIKDDRDFTEIYCADYIPTLSNDFLNLEINYFCFTRKEATELTQNLCEWLCEKGFTDSQNSF